MAKNKLIILILLFNLLFVSSKADSIINDSINSNELKCCENENFELKKLIVPGSIAIVGIASSIEYKKGINKSVNSWFENNKTCKVDNYLRFVPSVGFLCLGEIGVKAKHPFKERLAVFATSHVTMMALSYGLKFAVNEQRPDLSDCHSFPSGHVSTAFTGAELLREEYGTAYGLGGYAVATSVAILRLNNHKHWFGDVLVGASIGILSARVGYWLLPIERKLFKWNKKDSKNMVSTVPTLDFQTKSLGLSLVAQF